ncbi:MAG: hypothetical protein EA417_12435, partial [Gammaproteobacteria bacterium]
MIRRHAIENLDEAMMRLRWVCSVAAASLVAIGLGLVSATTKATVSQQPLFLTQALPPLVMLNLSNDNQLYFQAYPDYADLTGDGAANRTYEHNWDYYGYFDPYKCYVYTDGRFAPQSVTNDKYCNGEWSGNFLNWISMARIDVVRRLLYGGYRSTDTASQTVLERTYLPNDAHSWVRYYDGADLPQLTPFALPLEEVTDSTTEIVIPVGSRNGTDDRRTISTPWTSSQVQLGDQLRIEQISGHRWMEGVVLTRTAGNLEVQVTASLGAGDSVGDWQVTNLSRRGVSFCNTTATSAARSQDVTDPPLMRVARGDYSLWTANERWQCQWDEERRRTGHADMRVGGVSFSNGNNLTASGIPANADNPVRPDVGLGLANYNVRVAVCVDGLIGTEDCKRYPAGNRKPVGLLQQYGEDDQILFGLLTGTYSRNLSGGTLRKNIGSFRDEIDAATGRFVVPASGHSIVRSLNALRLYGYNQNTGVYEGAGDNCGVGVRKDQLTDGRCMNWGNPQAEIFLEALRYFAGLSPTPEFLVEGPDRLSGLLGVAEADWQDPLSTANWCAIPSIIQFNASVTSFDGDRLGGFSELPGTQPLSAWTNTVGAGEGIHGEEWYFGGADALCTGKNVGGLADVAGLCPEAPNQDGTFNIAGLAHFAYTRSIRDDIEDFNGQGVDINVKTYGVSLAPATPRIEIPRPGGGAPVVTILPACENLGDGGLRCALADFRIIDQDIAAGTGRFFIQWDVHEWGSDFDMDINGTLAYEITGNTIRVTTQTWAQSSARQTGFGYIISGTTQDGFHAHSGINNYSYVDPTGVLGCTNCRVGDPPTTVEYTLGGSPASLLENPLFYAAKWGGFDTEADFPADPQSWDRTGDGTPDNFYFAIDPGQLANDLGEVFAVISSAVTSASAVATNSTRLDSDTRVFQARFNPETWSGELLAFAVNPDGTIPDAPLWDAGQRIPLHAARSILTADPSGQGGRYFEWADLHEDQRALLNNDEQLLDYLRGDTSTELQNGGSFRDRESLLGDIVNSDPTFLGRQDFGYRTLPGTQGSTYPAFLATKQTRRSVLFVGANAGMLHAFDAQSGDELFAFVPNSVFPNLPQLAELNYTHRYFVDGSPRVTDAYVGGAWRTLLIGATGAGGRGVFILDVTDPEPTSIGPDSVLWEFSHPEMGYSIPQSTIARMSDGEFWAIIPNGYDSAGNTARLFLKRLHDGYLVEINTGEGTAAAPNGLSAPFPVDSTGDRTVNHIYAGDLQGNLWRFDVSGNSNNWGNSNNRRILSVASDASGQRQPI